MFDLMEATWPELSSCLGQLRDEVLSDFQAGNFLLRPARVSEEKPSPAAIERQQLVQHCLDAMRGDPSADENDWQDTLRDLLDARARGISILELEWGHLPNENILAPLGSRWVHPSCYGYPEGSGQSRLMLRVQGDGSPSRPLRDQWTDFPPDKFIVGICKNKTGHPMGSALLHVLAPLWAMQNFCTEWFFNYSQVFGQPFRWATYDPNMSAADQTKLQQVLANMGANAYAMFPAGAAFELKDTSKGASENPNRQLIDLANRTCRLLILRQTLTGDVPEGGAGSRALGEVHERVEAGVKTAVGLWLCKTLNQIVRSICLLNYGNDDVLPWFGPKEEQADEPKELGELLVSLNNAGLEPEDEALDDLSERIGIRLRRKATPALVPFGGSGATPPRSADRTGGADSEDGVERMKDERGHLIAASAGDGGGRWVTINGAPVFIEDGDSDADVARKLAGLGSPGHPRGTREVVSERRSKKIRIEDAERMLKQRGFRLGRGEYDSEKVTAQVAATVALHHTPLS